MQTEFLPRNVRIDWLRFQVSSYRPNFFRQLREIIGLPFEKKQQSALSDPRQTDVLAINKVWHEIYDFQNSWIGVKYPSTGSDEPTKHFVDLNAKTLSGLDFTCISNLLYASQMEVEFKANRIDIALDFPLQTPRLFHHYWELFVEDGLLERYRTVKRISNTGQSLDKMTVYLGSRESTSFVRMYAKHIDFDRLEVEFKRERAAFVMHKLASIPANDFGQYLDSIASNEIRFKTYRNDIEFYRRYRRGLVTVPAPRLHLDIEKSIAFIERHAATLAMLNEFMGDEKYDEFMDKNLEVGKLKMAYRHWAILSNAKALGVGFALFFLVFGLNGPAIASGLTCPAPMPLSFQAAQKFPLDIINPTPTEQAYLNNVGNGCFQINAGLEFQSICLPGMIVNALRPFIIMGLGIKFIFSD